MSGEDGVDCGCKLGRVADERELEGAPIRTVSEWREDGSSLRTLADRFNQRVLRSAMNAVGSPPLDGEVPNLYRLLTSDAVSPGMRTQARNRLTEDGVDVEAVETDFVSYQTINRHIKSCLGYDEADRANPMDADQAEDRVYSLQHRTKEVTERTIEQLHRSAGIDFGEFEVYVNLSARCTECGTQLGVDELLTGETCRCPE